MFPIEQLRRRSYLHRTDFKHFGIRSVHNLGKYQIASHKLALLTDVVQFVASVTGFSQTSLHPVLKFAPSFEVCTQL
jgi:hypothetical protein